MARNQEKAQAMLNRLVAARRDEFRGVKENRPHLASGCNDLHECDKWRAEIIKEISKEVTNIQNGSLGEHKIRDMNDHINKLLREKKHWERQIKFLGGPDHIANAPKVLDGDGKQAMGADGYFYFGAARELPGVRELFEKIIPDAPKRARFDLYKCIDADYYGFRDDDDGLLEKLEKKQERLSRIQAEKEWSHQQKLTAENEAKNNRKKRKRGGGAEGAEGGDEGDEKMEEGDEEEAKKTESETKRGGDGGEEGEGTEVDVYRSHVPLPSQQEIEKLILEKRREELLAKLDEEEEFEELEEEVEQQESIEKAENAEKEKTEKETAEKESSEKLEEDSATSIL